MKVDADKLRSDKAAQDLVFRALAAGKKVILRFVDDEDKAEFMDEIGSIGAAAGAAGGIAGGGIGGLIVTDAIIGAEVAGPAGLAAGATIGAATGLIAGSLVSYSLGAWLAHFIYGLTGGNIIVKDRKKGQVAIRLA